MLWSSCTDKKQVLKRWCCHRANEHITNPHLWGIPSTVNLLNISASCHTLHRSWTTQPQATMSPQHCRLHYWATPIPFHLPQYCSWCDRLLPDRQHLNPHSPTPTEAVTQWAGDTHAIKRRTQGEEMFLCRRKRGEKMRVLQLQAKRDREFSLVSWYMLYIVC